MVSAAHKFYFRLPRNERN